MVRVLGLAVVLLDAVLQPWFIVWFLFHPVPAPSSAKLQGLLSSAPAVGIRDSPQFFMPHFQPPPNQTYIADASQLREN